MNEGMQSEEQEMWKKLKEIKNAATEILEYDNK